MSAPRRDRLHQHRRFAAGGNGNDERDPRDVEIERLRERVRELEIQHEIRQIRKRIRELELTGNEDILTKVKEIQDGFQNQANRRVAA
ncbi:hypothetical protein Tco_0101142 [Tanacetum coccineum]